MKILARPQFLVGYSAIVTLAFAVTVLGGFASAPKKAVFDQIDVHRINVVEPDGTLRLVISDKAQFPGSFIKGKESARPDRQATGMLFLDDEGSEMGGLIWAGWKDKNGVVHSNGHLSFDQYMQDQIFAIDAGQEGDHHGSVLKITDRGDYPITEAMAAAERIRALPQAQQAAEWKKFQATHPGDNNRIVLGRAGDKSAVLRLKDTEGRDRLVLKVSAEGTPTLDLLDADGKVVSHLPQSDSTKR